MSPGSQGDASSSSTRGVGAAPYTAQRLVCFLQPLLSSLFSKDTTMLTVSQGTLHARASALHEPTLLHRAHSRCLAFKTSQDVVRLPAQLRQLFLSHGDILRGA